MNSSHFHDRLVRAGRSAPAPAPAPGQGLRRARGWTFLLFAGLIGFGGLALAAKTADAQADELTSASFRHQSGRFVSSSAAGAGALTSSANPAAFGQSESTIGEGGRTSPAGSDATLTTVWPGFWALVSGRLSGGFASLDIDGDLAQFFLDPDDDGDGLDDLYETGTGFFVSETNTGTSRTRADSDGDGFDDGIEVQAGTDPNDPGSSPSAPGVPSLTLPLQLLLLVLLLILPDKWAYLGLKLGQGVHPPATRASPALGNRRSKC